MVVFRADNSTDTPLRARSQAFFPLIFMAEYWGGICSISPEKCVLRMVSMTSMDGLGDGSG